MKQSMQNKHLGIILIFILILSGMCQQYVSTDSFFVYDEKMSETSVLKEAQNTSPVFRSLSADFLQETAAITQSRSRDSLLRRGEWRRSQPYEGVIRITPLFSFHTSLLSIWISILFPAFLSIFVIMQYIHHKDGAKPFVLFLHNNCKPVHFAC